METESLKPILSMLIWGGLFFLMMRFGCGAHMMGGHGRHGGHDRGGDPTDKETKDPVCGMAVDRRKSTAASTFAGKTYHFCSITCRDKFEAEPEKYSSGASREEPQPGGHLHG
jgi:YHS domain-containing protein